LDFILERARYVLKERSSLAHDEINAALAAGADDLVDAVRRAESREGHPQVRRTLSRWRFPSNASEKILEKGGTRIQLEASGSTH